MLRTIFKREEASTDYFVRLSVRLYVHMPDMTVSSLSTYRSSENLVYMIFFKVYTPLFPAYVFLYFIFLTDSSAYECEWRRRRKVWSQSLSAGLPLYWRLRRWQNWHSYRYFLSSVLASQLSPSRSTLNSLHWKHDFCCLYTLTNYIETTSTKKKKKERSLL